MAVPSNVKFDRYAQLTGGLKAVANEDPFSLNVNSVALVTGWLTSGIWSSCYDPISTTWTACYSAVTTVWSVCYSAVTTVWTRL